MQSDDPSGEGFEVNGYEQDPQIPEQTPPDTFPAARRVNRIDNINVKDHFSLSNPSSTVAFADDEAIVFVDNLEQVALHKSKKSGYITAKQATVSSPGLNFIRFLYTLVALLMTGFVFIFCIQIVLFLFLGLAIESGKKKLCYSSSSRLS